jgi:hypothetical protein
MISYLEGAENETLPTLSQSVQKYQNDKKDHSDSS